MTTSQGRYEIRLRGHIDQRWADRLGVLSISHEGDGTSILHGISDDQAAVHGILQRIRDLGLPLISVIRFESDRPA